MDPIKKPNVYEIYMVKASENNTSGIVITTPLHRDVMIGIEHANSLTSSGLKPVTVLSEDKPTLNSYVLDSKKQ